MTEQQPRRLGRYEGSTSEHNPFELLREKRPAMYKLMSEMVSIMLAKSHDYNEGQGDSYENLRASTKMGIPPWKGVLLRMSDKFSRLCSFANKQAYEVKDESFRDTLVDLSNYCLLCVLMYEEEDSNAA